MVFKNLKFFVISIMSLFSAVCVLADDSEYYYNSYQISDQHRYDYGKMGAHWGHHLGHLVRTATQGLWYVDDTGTNVNRNPALHYHHFNGRSWQLIKQLSNPNTIQQNTASIAIGDSIFSYGLNINGGYIEEAVFNARTHEAIYNRKIFATGASTNYIGAAVSPGGKRIVWWTRVVNNNGPSPWLYVYHDGESWHGPIQSMVPGNDFSYVFASFVNDNELYVAGEVPGGIAPNWTYQMGVGKIVLGNPLENFTLMPANFTAHDIWVNTNNGDVHLFGHSFSSEVSYFYKPAAGNWPEFPAFLPIGGAGRFRIIEDAFGKLYLVFSQSGFKMIVMNKAEVTGELNLDNFSKISINHDQGFISSNSIWAETREYQTTPVLGLNFGFHGNDWDYSNLLRHCQVLPNDGSVKFNLSLPNGNETLIGGNNHQISWYVNSAANINSLKIDLSTDGGQNWSTIAESIPNNGAYQWQVPETNSTTCKIRISDSENSAISDMSDTTFTIFWEEIVKTPPVATIHSPQQDTTITVNTIFTARGNGADDDGYIVRYLWQLGDGNEISGVSKTSVEYEYTTVGTYYLTLEVKDNDDQWSIPDSIKITVTDPTAVVNDDELKSQSMTLIANYPNPFNAATNIYYQLNISSVVKLSVYNIHGELVKDMINNRIQPAGEYHHTWDGKNSDGRSVPTGCYFSVLETNQTRKITKMLLLR